MINESSYYRAAEEYEKHLTSPYDDLDEEEELERQDFLNEMYMERQIEDSLYGA